MSALDELISKIKGLATPLQDLILREAMDDKEYAEKAAKELAALRARVEELEAGLEFMLAYNDHSGDAGGEWQTYAKKRWGGIWSIKMIEDAISEVHALLEAK